MFVLILTGDGDGELHVMSSEAHIPERAIVARYETLAEAEAARVKLNAWAAHVALRTPVRVELAPISLHVDGRTVADVVYPHISQRLDGDMGTITIATPKGPRP